MHSTPSNSPLPTEWQLARRRLTLVGRPLLMGILNVTPDSFFDGGKPVDSQAAIERGLQLAFAGADILDIGGESTRPGAEPVDERIELARVLPVIQGLAAQISSPISIDTSKAGVAREAMAAGAQIVNDVTAMTGDPAMARVIADSKAAVCLMHMRGTPATMQHNPQYDDVVEEVLSYLQARRDAALAVGIEQSRIVLDPGIGFGKTGAHNIRLLTHIGRLHVLGCPLLVGPSRKKFLGELIGDIDADRLPATIGVSIALASQGVQILRVHDVAQVRQALDAFGATAGFAGQ